MPRADLLAHGVAEPIRRGRRQGRRDCDVGKPAVGKAVAIGQLDRDHLAGVDRAPTSEADDPVHADVGRVCDGGIDLSHGCVLADDLCRHRLDAVHRFADAAQQRAFGDERPGGDDGDARDLQPAELRRQLGERPCAPMNRARVRVVDCPGLRRHVRQYVTFEASCMAGPHQGQAVVQEGEPLETARAAMILAHGRGASALDIMTIAAEVMFPGVAYLAPQAAGSVWYPNPFTAPFEANEPYLSSPLEVLSTLGSRVRTSVCTARVVLLGWSHRG